MSKKFRLVITLVLGIVFLWGCGTVPRKSKKPIENVKVFKGSYDNVWYAAIDMLGKLEFPLVLSQKRDGIITTDWVKFKRKTYSLGIKSWKERSNLEKVQVSLRILSVGDGIEVKATVFNEDFVGIKGMLWKSHWMKTYSKGELEKDMLSKISIELEGEEAILTLTAQPDQLVSDKKSVALVTASMIDENGNLVISANGKVMFSVSGPAKLSGKNPAKMKAGVAVIKVKSTKEAGNIEVTAAFQDVTSEAITIVSAYPVEEVPAEEVPAEEAPVEEVPAEEVPAEEVPAEEVPAEEVPAEEVPAEEVPAEEAGE